MAVIYGTGGPDTRIGTGANDNIYGWTPGGNASSPSGNDPLFGEAGNDFLYGGTANDSLYGGPGLDNLYGGQGNDTLDGGLGSDVLNGGAGNDIYIVNSAADRITEATNSGTDTVQSTFSYTLSTNLENLTLKGTGASNGTGNSLNNKIIGNAANNTLNGRAGNDTLDGGNGNDTLNGGNGNDNLVGSAGNDIFTGGAGSDTADYIGFGEAIAILPQGVISKGSLGTDSISSVERIVGAKGQANAINGSSSTGEASLTVNLAENSLIVNGIPGLSTISFTVENFVDVTGTPNADTITGNSGNNVLDGKAGNDTLLGEADNDYLVGEKGNDTLTGGGGADTFVFNFPTEGIDTITDFEFQQGDKIQVSASGFGIGQGQYDQFTFQESATEGALFFQGTQFASLQLGTRFTPSLDITIV